MESNERNDSLQSAEARLQGTQSGQGKRKRGQKQKLLDYLLSHYDVTQLEAFNGLGICRLSERVRELEADGYLIGREWVKTSGGARVIRYWYLGNGH